MQKLSNYKHWPTKRERLLIVFKGAGFLQAWLSKMMDAQKYSVNMPEIHI